MLLTLHVWLLSSPLVYWSAALKIVHYGMFLLWQPIWRSEQRLNWLSAMLFVLGGLLLLAMQGWWLRAFWLAGLIGLLGGRVFSARARHERFIGLVAVGYLLAMLLMWVEPHLIGLTGTIDAARWAVTFVMPVLPLGLLFVRIDRDQAPSASIDFFYSLLLFLLAVILVMGSFIIEAVTHDDYALVLMQVMFTIAMVLVILSWLWNPRSGFTGLGELFSRYLMSVGMPFEQWLQNIAVLADTSPSATRFLNAAADAIAKLPWVSGGVWQSETSGGNFGETSPHKASFTYHGLRITLFTRSAMSPALTLHVKLLAQLLGEFYEAKLREEQMRSLAYLQAIHETGARLTHDVKNILQSLDILCAAAGNSAEGDNRDRLVALIQRQLPQLSQRLKSTLDKLQTPQPETSVAMNASTWWNRLRQRYRESGIEFTSDKIMAGSDLPGDMFDSIVDNLIQNALEKRKMQLSLKISVRLTMEDSPALTVEDDGMPVPAGIVEQLFKSPLPSLSGLGIGLYQMAKQAQQQGYRLALTSNKNGAVRFDLTRA
jgi:signal transduction histidine kinase